MAKSIIKNMKIRGMSVVLGEEKRFFKDEPFYWDNNMGKFAKLQKTMGFDTIYWANKNTTTADLCQQATLSLMKHLNIKSSSIDAIISITQTPDYYMPGNAHIIHRNLKFSKDTIAYDAEFGCSGYIYGLYTAAMMLNAGLKRILLIAGDTLSKCLNKKDKTTAPIFSDAGSATIIDFDKNSKNSYFILKSNGNGVEYLWQPAKAYRTPSSNETKKESTDENGNIRSQENLYMNGAEVFNFTLTEQPELLNEIVKFANLTKEDIDYFIFHQANVYIVETILKKAKISFQKAPSKIFSKYGNQNCASIPTAICEDLSEKFTSKKKVLMQGFGIGLSWGACITDLNDVLCLKPQIYKGKGDE